MNNVLNNNKSTEYSKSSKVTISVAVATVDGLNLFHNALHGWEENFKGNLKDGFADVGIGVRNGRICWTFSSAICAAIC